MNAKQIDKDLVEHACSQLAKIARQKVREGLGPESAARAAIRETKALFPHDWNLGVQGGDDEEAVEVWEVEHKHAIPCARITKERVLERAVQLTEKQIDILDTLHRHVRRGARSFSAPQRRLLPKLVDRGLIEIGYRDEYQLTDEGRDAYRASREEDDW